jgi:hypothetical protein
MRQMKQNRPPKSDDIKGNVDQTKIARGALPRFSGQGYHADKREKRAGDQKRKELRNEVAPVGFPTFSEWLKNNHGEIYDENAKSILLAGLAGAGIGAGLGAAAPHTKDYDPKNALHHAVGAKHTAMDAFSDMPIEKRVGLGGALGAAAGAGALASALRKRKGNWMKK